MLGTGEARARDAPSADELTRAFAYVDHAFGLVQREVGSEQSSLHVVAGEIRLIFAGRHLALGVLPSLAHKRMLAPAAEAALTICLCDGAASGRKMPLPSWLEQVAERRTDFPTYRSRRIEALYDWQREALYLLDRHRRRAIYWVRNAALVPLWEHAGALRQILVWWLRDGPVQLLHAGAVGRPDGGVLLVGRSGSGKTTATAACIGSSLAIVGDDTVLARAEPKPSVESLYSALKLTPNGLTRLPALRSLVANPGRGADEKAIVYLSEQLPERLIDELPLRALLIPRIVSRPQASLTPARPAQGLLALAPSTLFQANGGHHGAFRVLARLVEQVPCYVLEVGTDLRQIPEMIEALLDGRAAHA